jgi:O-antigen/teichoic acid export membrane protein
MSPQRPGQAPLPPPDAARRTTGASLIGGGVWRLASMLLPQVTNLILSVAIARLLGPPDFGRQSFIAFVALSTMTLLSTGLGLSLTRYSAESLGRGEGGAVWGLVRLTAAIDLIGALIGGAALGLAGVLGAEPSAAWQLAGLGTALAIMQTVPNAVLMGAQRFRDTSVIGLTTTLVSVPSTIAVVASGGGITGIFAVEAVVAAVNLTWSVLFARRTLRATAPAAAAVERRSPAPFLRFAALTTLDTLLFLVVWRRSEFFFLNAYSSDAEIGFYSIAFALVNALVLIPQSVASVTAPAFATLFGAGESGRIRSGYGRAMRLVTLGTLPLAAGAFALGPAAIELLYGKDYARAGEAVRVMLALFPLVPLFSVSGSLLEGLGRAGMMLVMNTAAAAINIGLDFVLIPKGAAVGAAAASTIAQAVVIVPMVIYATRLVGGMRIHARELAKAVLASAASGVAAWATWTALEGVAGLLLAIAAAVVVFALLAAILRILPAEDAEWLEGAAGERLGGLVGRACRVLTSAPAASPSS